MNPPEILIALVDDHKLIRQTLGKALSAYPFIKVLFDAENATELFSELKKQQPDVLLLDIRMPGMSGMKILKILYEQYPGIRVLILSAFYDEVYVARCQKYGINGYLTKSMDLEEVVPAIRMASQNNVYFSNPMMKGNARNYLEQRNKKSAMLLPDFTEEEITIAELLHQEKTTEEISAIMCLSKRSIEIKREKMKEKAKVKTIAGLIEYCVKRGFIDGSF